jgi:signal transduction histidine kinase
MEMTMPARSATPRAKTTRDRRSPKRDHGTARAFERQLSEALEQQAATAEILRVISQSPSDAQPVFETITANALRLCDATFSVCYRFDGEFIHIAALHNVNPQGIAAFHAAYPSPPNRGGATQRAILTGEIVNIANVLEDPEYVYHDAAKDADYRSVLSVPMLRDRRPIGALTVFREAPEPFPDTQVALLKTFAEQALIAIENVRLFTELESRNRDLTEALEQQTATSEMLRVISQSQTDVQPVFESIVRSALSLCGAEFSGVYLLDGETLSLAATAGLTPMERERFHSGYPRRIGPETVSGRAALECRVVQTPDLINDPEFSSAPGTQVGARAVLGVPMMRDGRAIGSIGVWRSEIRLFSDSQIALLQTFADQAVIAIENVRLFTELEGRNRELTEALEQQTATSEILRVISQSPRNVQPVFDTIAAAALRLCNANSVNVFTFDGKLIDVAALANANPDGPAAVRKLYPRPPSRDSAAARTIMTRDVVMIPDVLDDGDYSTIVPGFRSALGIPLIRNAQPIGAIVVGRPDPGPFPDAQIALLKTFADQAVIAIENVRLLTELETRTSQLIRSVDELKALGEVGHAVSSTLDLPTVLSTIVSRATKLAGMAGGAIYEYDGIRGEFHLHTTDHLPDELVQALRAKPIPKGEGALGRMAVSHEPVQIRDIANEPGYQSRLRETLIRLGYRSLLAVPLLRDDHLLGGLVVHRNTAGEFAPQVIDLLKALATQSALAIQNARLFREIEVKSGQLETASQHKSEFLANMSHELRTPLNAIIGFSEVLSEQMFGVVNEKQAEYLTDILESGRHLLSLINDILDLSKIEAGRMELEIADFDLPGAIENALILVRERANRHGVALVHSIDPHLGSIRADQRKVKQVLLNLLSNALKFTPEGGRIEVRAVVRDGTAEVSVTDTGVGIAPKDQAAVFEEFRQVGSAAKKVEGTGLGLAISRKFIELHGGNIWVTSKPGAGSTFAFTLPLRSPAR